MKVDIKRSEGSFGIFKKTKTYNVTLHVQLTEEEKKLIEETGVRDHVLVERPRRAGVNDGPLDIFHLYVWNIMKDKPEEYEFLTLAAATDYYNQLPGALKALKSLLDKNANSSSGTSFEL